MIDKPELGQWMTITTYLHKRRRGRDISWERDIWQKTPLRGMFIGIRQIYDGELDWGYGEEGVQFKRTAAHSVWLFVLDGRRNPVYVLPEDVTP